MCIRILAGQYFDEETGLHYNYHRYYDPKMGRYLTPDPIGLRGGINLFVYAGNNPINAIDPFGLMEDAIRAPKGFFGRQLDSVNTRIRQFNNPEVWGPGQGEKNFMLLVDVATVALSFGAEKIGRTCLSKISQSVEGATVEELIQMMNRRIGVKAEYATGDALEYLKKIGAEGSHFLQEGGGSHILLRKDIATRRTAFHEWLHRILQRRAGGPRRGEDKIIEQFLERHKKLFVID